MAPGRSDILPRVGGSISNWNNLIMHNLNVIQIHRECSLIIDLNVFWPCFKLKDRQDLQLNKDLVTLYMKFKEK